MMGTVYSVACRDCKITRDLDKFRSLATTIETREEALALSTELLHPGMCFRAALLTSFLWEHKGHNCTVFSGQDETLCEELDPFYGQTKADISYW